MRSKTPFRMKSLTLLATLLALPSAMAQDTWKPAAALPTNGTEEQILKRVSADQGSAINVDYTVPEPRFEANEDQTYKGEKTELCTLGNAGIDGKPGEPLLPYITARIILPGGHTVKSVRAVPTDARRAEGHHLLSYGETPVPLSSKSITRTAAKPSVYESQEVYPSATTELVSINDRCGVSIATIHIYPLHYSPATREVDYWKAFRLEVETEAQRAQASDGDGIRVRLERFQEEGMTEENPGTLQTYQDKRHLTTAGEEAEAAESYSFVIVTSKAIINATTTPNLKDYVAHKTRMGHTVKVAAIEDIQATSPGSTSAEKLRNFLRDAYNKWNTKFVLLGGDTNIIPLYTVPASNGGTSDNLPSDMPYQCLSQATWNNDYEAEVFIGRASAQDATEFSNFIYKTMAFENSDPSDPYLKSELGAGEKMDASTQAKGSILALQKIFPTNWTFGGIYDADGTWSSPNDAIKQINSNKYSIIDHMGHSNTNYVMKLSSSSNWNTNSPFTNTKFFFIKSQGCIPGAFDRDCSAEHWTTSSRTGAWGVVFNSRYGWYMPGNPTGGSSHNVHMAFWNAFWKQNLKTVGECNEYSHRTNTSYRWDILESNLLGDPTVSFKVTNQPPSDGPKANFTFTQNNGNAVTFTDASTCSNCVINAWAWDFGDGTSSKEKNPVHTYARTGTYNVKLAVTTQTSKTDTVTKSVQTTGGGSAYCPSKSGNSGYFHINNFTVGSFSNPSGASNYSDFTSKVIPITTGKATRFSIGCGNQTGYHNTYAIWVDLNRDGNFNGPGELLYSSGTGITGGSSGSITIPTGTTAGKTRMRIIQKNGNSVQPCESFTWGEVEDYTVEINSGGGDPGTPTAPTGLKAAASGSSALSITWSPSAGATGYDLQVDGTLKSNVTSPFAHTGLASGSNHTYLVRAKNSAGTSAWSTQVTGSLGGGGDTQETPAHRVLYLTNLERKAKGVPPLKGQDQLFTASGAHALDMAQKNYFSHTSQDGRTFDQRVTAAGYKWNTCAENIAAGNSTAETTVDQWKNSSGHYANMINASYREMGVGYAQTSTSTYKHYWVQDFGTQSDVYPVIIQDEAFSTSDRRVSLYVYGSGWAREMMISEDPNFAGATWQPFLATPQFDLSQGAGLKRVYVRLRNASGTEKTAMDEIVLR